MYICIFKKQITQNNTEVHKTKNAPHLPVLKTLSYLFNVQVARRATSEFIKYSQEALIWYQNYLVPKGVLRKSLLGTLAHGLLPAFSV